tara:strand:- start:490 stop:732 length:243 start_codon:yes stop_codon:yes gene_type:complete
MLNDMKEEIKDRVLDAINSGRDKGLSLKEICEEVFGDDDSVDFTDFNDENMKAVFQSLDDLLEEEVVYFNDEQDLWTAVE